MAEELELDGFKVTPKLSVIVQSAPEAPEDGMHPEQSSGWQQRGDGCSELTVKRGRCVTAKDQPWKQQQKGRGRFGALSVLQQELTAGFGGREAVVLPRPWGEGWCPNQGADTMGGTKSV